MICGCKGMSEDDFCVDRHFLQANTFLEDNRGYWII